MSNAITGLINSIKKTLVLSMTLTIGAMSAVTFLSASSTNAQDGVVRGRVISIWEARSQSIHVVDLKAEG